MTSDISYFSNQFTDKALLEINKGTPSLLTIHQINNSCSTDLTDLYNFSKEMQNEYHLLADSNKKIAYTLIKVAACALGVFSILYAVFTLAIPIAFSSAIIGSFLSFEFLILFAALYNKIKANSNENKSINFSLISQAAKFAENRFDKKDTLKLGLKIVNYINFVSIITGPILGLAWWFNYLSFATLQTISLFSTAASLGVATTTLKQIDDHP